MESWFRPWRGDKSRALLGLGPGEETSPGLGFEYVMGGSQGTGLGPITGISSTGHVWIQHGGYIRETDVRETDVRKI